MDFIDQGKEWKGEGGRRRRGIMAEDWQRVITTLADKASRRETLLLLSTLAVFDAEQPQMADRGINSNSDG